jgi:surfactin synthase thioesterase subunit/glycosyltransferase involved in cell wall biosynthesis
MRILLAHNSLYFPSHGGGDKSNRLLMDALAERGHQVQVLARLENFGEAEHERFLGELEARQTRVKSIRDGVVEFQQNRVSVFTVTSNPRLRNAFAARIEAFDPDVILCSTDDPGALLLEVALRYPRARVVYLVRATVAVPFGPDCAFPNASKTEMIGRVDSIVGVSEYVARYVREWSGYPAIHVPISLLEAGDYSDMGRFDNELVLMVNPCAVKGISIFAGLAEVMPGVAFAAIPTWGTNEADLALLKRRANIRLLAPVDDMAVVLRRTRVVLVPSVWAEARSRMVVEAMIRGIPVMASDVGGLHEAKLGIEYLLPVNPIQHYHARVDANMVPVAEVPPQDIEPWRAALHRLLSDRAHYEDVSRRSREAALEYASKLHCGWLEAHLEELIQNPKREASAATLAAATAIESLSPAKRRLLALRLQKARAPRAQQAPGSGFFPDIEALANAERVLYCLPWAGGGTALYRSWRGRLGERTGVCAVRLPGRESRLGEAPFMDIRVLVASLTEALRPHLGKPFAFYGHSMGAGIAFELARSLRRNGLPMPSTLLVSSARAPQLRTEAPQGPDPADEELLDQIERLGGLAEDHEVVRLALPALRADTHLYRHYLYEPDAPLALPICVYGGSEDPSLEREHSEAWREQTTEGFSLKLWPAGHFFFREFEAEFLDEIRRELNRIRSEVAPKSGGKPAE